MHNWSLILMHNFKVGDRVKVVSQDWHKPSLIGKVGVIVQTLSPGEYCILFSGWKEGHTGIDKSGTSKSYWNLGGRQEDKVVLASEQLEFNFDV